MKIIYVLDTEKDDASHINQLAKAGDMAGALWEIAYNMKKGVGYWIDGQENVSAYDALDEVFNRIFEILDESNICIDELYE